MVGRLITLLAIVCVLSAETHGLDVHCDKNELDGCYLKLNLDNHENLDIHEPTTLNFIDADRWNDEVLFTIPPYNTVSVMPSGIFTRFPKLNQVQISTGLRAIQKDDFRNADALTILQLNANKLQVIPSNVFSKASKLTHIDLSFNQLKTIEDFAFNVLSKLEAIYLQNNNLTSLKRNTFAGAVNLSSIKLAKNQIASIEDGTFDLPNLQTVDLLENSMHSLSDNLFMGAPKLFFVLLSENGLTHIGQSFYRSNNINFIFLDGNRIEDLDLSSFARMPELTTLSLKNTGLSFENVSKQSDSANSSVIDLDISSNGLSNSDVLNRLERMGFVNLQSLNLEQNQFTNIDDIDHIKKKFKNIALLGFSGNRLTCDWIENAVKFLTEESVFVINLSGTRPNEKTFDGIACV